MHEKIKKAATLLLGDLNYGLGFTQAYIDNARSSPHLVIRTRERHVADNEYYKKELKLSDYPYLDGMSVLEQLGVSSEHIKGGYIRNDQGQVVFEEGTFGKRGDYQRVYTVCELTAPIEKINLERATSIVETAELAKKISEGLRDLFPLSYASDGQIPYKVGGVSHQVDVMFGSDYSEAAERLSILREFLGKSIREKGSSINIDDILPQLPDSGEGNSFTIELKDRTEVGNLLLSAVDKALRAQEGERKWAKEEAIRATGVDEELEKLPEVLAAAGFSGATVKRQPCDSKIHVAFPDSLSADGVERLRIFLYEAAQQVSPNNGLQISAREGRKIYAVASPGLGQYDMPSNFPQDGVKALTIDFHKTNPPTTEEDDVTIGAQPLKSEEFLSIIKNIKPALHRSPTPEITSPEHDGRVRDKQKEKERGDL